MQSTCLIWSSSRDVVFLRKDFKMFVRIFHSELFEKFGTLEYYPKLKNKETGSLRRFTVEPSVQSRFKWFTFFVVIFSVFSLFSDHMHGEKRESR